MTDAIIEEIPLPPEILIVRASGDPERAWMDLERLRIEQRYLEQMDACVLHDCGQSSPCGNQYIPDRPPQSRDVALLVHTCRGCQRRIFGAQSFICPECSRASCSACAHHDGQEKLSLEDAMHRPCVCADCRWTWPGVYRSFSEQHSLFCFK
jgi:hypothetical protein